MSKNKDTKISKLVFRHYEEISEEGINNSRIVQDSLIARLQYEPNVDTAALEVFKQISITELFKPASETEIHIDVNQDTIWRYTKQHGEIIGHMFRIDREKGILFYHSKNDKSMMYRQFNLFDVGGDFLVEEFPTDRKKLMGYDCHKVVIRKKEQIEADIHSELGDTIYEMYVTKKIDLPAHTLINFTKNFSDFFPLEVKIWEEKLAGSHEVYEIKEIKEIK